MSTNNHHDASSDFREDAPTHEDLAGATLEIKLTLDDGSAMRGDFTFPLKNNRHSLFVGLDEAYMNFTKAYFRNQFIPTTQNDEDDEITDENQGDI